MRELPNKSLKKSELMACLCAPGVVAEALEHLVRGPSAREALPQCVRYDPVLSLRFSLMTDGVRAAPELLRGMLLAVPVASGSVQAAYGVRWRQSVTVAHLAQALAQRAGAIDPEAAWTAGLCHNLADYLDIDTPSPTLAAACLAGLDTEGWLADAVAFHAEPLLRGRAAHPLVRVTQLAYQLVVRADAVDSVDVRAALASVQLGAGEAAQRLAESQMHVRQQAQRFGMVEGALSNSGEGHDRLARLYAGQAAQAALHLHFRQIEGEQAVLGRLAETLTVLFGIERACLFVPDSDGCLRASANFPARAGLHTLAIPTDDGHSALPRALARQAPQQFEWGEAEAALVDLQIARLLGASGFLCQPLTLSGGQVGVLVAGDAAPGLGVSPLWRALLAECADALRVHALPDPVQAVPHPTEGIPRERVRRAIHEVANPLTIMRNYVNLLSERLGNDSSVQRDLDIIGDEIERVARIVRSLATTEDVAAQVEPVELTSVNGLVSELVRMALGTLLAPNKITVQIDLNPDVPPLPLNKDLLKQVLFNLAKNAVEAMPAGGHLNFTTRLEESGGQREVEIEIADTGPGLPPEIVTHLFEPVASNKGGDHAGLGLAISRNLVERLSGRLDCRSTPQGTRFLIRLPTLLQGQAPTMTTRVGSM